MSNLITTNSAARIIECAPATVLYHHRLGRIKAQRTESGLRLFNRAEVEKFAKQWQERKAKG